MAKNTLKEVKLESILGKLTPAQRKEFAAQFNGGMGMGKKPQAKKSKESKKKA